jgi:sec-independent protein translocase protein TatA
VFESPSHWLVVAIVAVVLFVFWKQLPDVARSIGRSLRIFKTEMKGMSQDDEKREKERARGDAAESGEPPASAPRALPPAEVVRNPAARPAAEPDPAERPRPRPAPRSSTGGSE